jgi:branched-subunit amino acid aminotransferase/4-amino-4-deoxychorismate lyase
VRVEVNGTAVEADPVPAGSTGHFTAMQVRARAVRGLDLHLRRLETANDQMFGIGLDRERVRELIRGALGDTDDASVRVYVRRLDDSSEPEIVVTVRPPGGIDSPQRLRSVDYLRPTPHLKHLATEQGECRRIAREAGFDDALLTKGFDIVAEAAIANVGFFEGPSLLWPEAPVLRGITMQLLDGAIPNTTTRVVRLRDVAAFDGALVCNARGIAMVSAIDETPLADASARIEQVRNAYETIAWDRI